MHTGAAPTGIMPGLSGVLPCAPDSAAAGLAAGAGAAPAALAVEAVWGDITATEADLYAVGHHAQALPSRAERALDAMVSGPGAGNEALVLAGLARRGALRGLLGDVNFFPWARASAPGAQGRMVAVVGMGCPGSVGSLELRQLARNLVWAAQALPDVRTVCTVLIGSGGEGDLPVETAVDAWVAGLADAVGPSAQSGRLRRLAFVEHDPERAGAIGRRLRALGERGELKGRIELRAASERAPHATGFEAGHAACTGPLAGKAVLAPAGTGAARAATDASRRAQRLPASPDAAAAPSPRPWR